MAQPPRGGGLSLYANLLDPKDPPPSSATISSAPVVYDKGKHSGGEAVPKQPADPSLRFQPIRRPQAKQANKTKPSFPKVISKPVGEAAVSETRAPAAAAAAAATAATATAPKSTLADWAATEEDEWKYGTGEKRQRGGRKKKKRKQDEQVEIDWDEIYDPTKPTNIDEYLRSDEMIDEVKDWKALLYRHRKKAVDSDMSDDEDTGSMPQKRFAPPPSFNAFAPPPPSPPRTDPNDTSQGDSAAPPPPPEPRPASLPPPPPPVEDSATISRAPVRYTQATEKEDDRDEDMDDRPAGLGSSNDPGPDDSAPRSSRPGQSGFAQRLMSKYGWTRGTGLGADESGIVNPLQVHVEKRRKKADADGGGWAEPGGKGKIVGGKRREESSKFGAMSEVIVLHNMLDNVADLQAEIADGLAQEIGEECGEKYGRVERLYIDQSSRKVFIKFTNQVSALRAVDALDGRIFNGNTIMPKFFDVDKFERGMYH